jgi:cytidyltransferase-like protein
MLTLKHQAPDRPGSCFLTRVYVDMVADLFHFGHVAFLKQASAFGDYLLVGIMSDASVRANKRMPIMTMEERVASLSGCRYVNEVIPDAPWTMNADFMEQHAIDLINSVCIPSTLSR